MAIGKIFIVDKESLNCLGCCNRTTKLFCVEASQVEADYLYSKGFGGLCSSCLVELLNELDVSIVADHF